jgi:hypothetical protein
VTIPFSFHVGGASLPAGTYVIEYPMSTVISLKNLNGRDNASVFATTKSGSVPPRGLVFNRYGNEYFLRETLTARGESEMTFAPTKLERSISVKEAQLQNQGPTLAASKYITGARSRAYSGFRP